VLTTGWRGGPSALGDSCPSQMPASMAVERIQLRNVIRMVQAANSPLILLGLGAAHRLQRPLMIAAALACNAVLGGIPDVPDSLFATGVRCAPYSRTRLSAAMSFTWIIPIDEVLPCRGCRVAESRAKTRSIAAPTAACRVRGSLTSIPVT
jgi:hypothetical protein